MAEIILSGLSGLALDERRFARPGVPRYPNQAALPGRPRRYINPQLQRYLLVTNLPILLPPFATLFPSCVEIARRDFVEHSPFSVN